MPSISMKTHPLASPALSIRPNDVMDDAEVSLGYLLQEDSMIAAAWRMATLPPETLPKTVATMVVVTTAGETIGGGGSCSKSEPQNVRTPEIASAWSLPTEAAAEDSFLNRVAGIVVFVAPSRHLQV